ncbi:hypothetical protein R3W88_008122 [Solanum pinnatisectum]|uniref:phospholipase D n=1 Tax=Solanum pinnatisectum TaxID=50273 RepID=A0AAV9M7Q1_9SOLN|nr:hypothetical protein R3W88_008122 [Solanum pinnatisectum]
MHLEESCIHFSRTDGCQVTLNSDADILDDIRNYLESHGLFEPQRCWEDIFDAVNNAKYMIYSRLVSVYKNYLDKKSKKTKGGELTLEELLKKKASERVNVLLLVWDNITSNGGFQVGTMFTHHQKTIVVDAEIPGGMSHKRMIVSFLGGIDLCDGRYDTRDRSLFRTIDTIHKQDFYQPSFPGSSIAKGEGPVVWDVLYHFEQRWRKQIGNRFIYLMNEDRETWNVQIFQSIDGAAVGLVIGKTNVIDQSIHDAYISAIYRAKNFIYIENQYFIGSCYGWKPANDIKLEDIGVLHLIPNEISLNIVSKTQAEERFVNYFY